MKTTLLPFAFVILLAASACQSVLATPAAAPALYHDDFSNPDSGWVAAPAAGAQAGYADGVYRLYLDAPNSDVHAGPGLELGDVRVEADAIRAAGGRDNRFGLLCRVTPAGDYYVFLVSSDGYYGIGKVAAGQYLLLGAESLLRSEAIPQGTAYMRLRADCVKDRLALYVNDQKIFETSDAQLASGDVGLAAGSYGAGGTEILFDNFTVSAP